MKLNEIKKKHVDLYKKSGLSKTEYCRLKDLKRSTFQTWYSKYETVKKENIKLNDSWKTLELIETESDIFELKISDNFKIELNLRFSF